MAENTLLSRIKRRLTTGQRLKEEEEEQRRIQAQNLAPETRIQEPETPVSISELREQQREQAARFEGDEEFQRTRGKSGNITITRGGESMTLSAPEFAAFEQFRAVRQGRPSAARIGGKLTPQVEEALDQSQIAAAVIAEKGRQIQQEFLRSGNREAYAAELKDLEFLPSEMTLDQAREFFDGELPEPLLADLGISGALGVAGKGVSVGIGARVAAGLAAAAGAPVTVPATTATIIAIATMALLDMGKTKKRTVDFADRKRADVEKAIPKILENAASGASSPAESVKAFNQQMAILRAADSLLKEEAESLIGSQYTDAVQKRAETLDLINEIMPLEQDRLRNIIETGPRTTPPVPTS